MQKKLSSKRLENHPDAENLILLNGQVYIELYTEVEYILGTDLKKTYSRKLYKKGIVLAIDEHCDLAIKYKVKKGNTVYLSKDFSLEEAIVMSKDESIENPYAFFFSFKTDEEFEAIKNKRYIGETILVDQSYVAGKLNENTQVEEYPPLEKSVKILSKNATIIN